MKTNYKYYCNLGEVTKGNADFVGTFYIWDRTRMRKIYWYRNNYSVTAASGLGVKTMNCKHNTRVYVRIGNHNTQS